METQDLDRIRFVTRHFHDLQGLRSLVPIGLIALTAGGVAGAASPALLLLAAVPFLAAVLLLAGAGRYYRSAFGEVEVPRVRAAAEPYALSVFNPAGSTPWLDSSPQAISSGRRLPTILMMAPAAFAVFQLLFWPPWIKLNSVVIYDGADSFVPMSPSAFGTLSAPLLYALCGSLFLGLWLLRQRRLSQSYHLALGALLLGLVPLPGASPLWVALLLCGSALVLAGLLDHRQLVRALGAHS
ncbi:MAG TPA: hypothetical protein VH988_06780 [Thermoanaerobaculia bacterium]|jgi:hypothetical protein|nr:hypothetical protein [Thermoanaerobaculia bacterium]